MLDRSSKFTPAPSAPVPAADRLSELLLGMRLSGVSHGRYRLTAPFGIAFPAQAEARFHFICQGGLVLQSAAGAQPLAGGDAVLLPRGTAHELVSAAGVACTGAQSLAPGERHGGISCLCEGIPQAAELAAGGALLFTGSMRFDLDTLHPLIGLMPEVMSVRDLAAAQPELVPLLEAMSREMTMDRAGAAGILARLADVVAASIVRAWVESDGCTATGWLEALRDRRLGRVIAAIHREPARDWTVAALAAEMGASRSAFAERFQAVTGETPLRYVTGVRMRLAQRWLGQERQPIEAVAARLGYGSQAAFSRAFKRETGQAPGAARAG